MDRQARLRRVADALSERRAGAGPDQAGARVRHHRPLQMQRGVLFGGKLKVSIFLSDVVTV